MEVISIMPYICDRIAKACFAREDTMKEDEYT